MCQNSPTGKLSIFRSVSGPGSSVRLIMAPSKRWKRPNRLAVASSQSVFHGKFGFQHVCARLSSFCQGVAKTYRSTFRSCLSSHVPIYASTLALFFPVYYYNDYHSTNFGAYTAHVGFVGLRFKF